MIKFDFLFIINSCVRIHLLIPYVCLFLKKKKNKRREKKKKKI